MLEPEEQEMWWDEEDDAWSEKVYFETLADHFQQQLDIVKYVYGDPE